MSKKFAVLGGTIGVIALLGATATPAMASQTGDTVTTFSLSGGTLNIAVQPNATLTDGRSGDTVISGKLGDVTVTDSRGNVLGWTASAASTTFTSNTGATQTTSLAVTYDSGAVTKTGTVTATGLGPIPLTTTALPVVAGTLVVGNHTAKWDPTLTVALPPTSLAGDYTGTVTTSVA